MFQLSYAEFRKWYLSELKIIAEMNTDATKK